MRWRPYALGAAGMVGAGWLWASMTLTPASHDFGQVVVGGSAYQSFQLTGTSPLGMRGKPQVRITGDVANFSIDSTSVTSMIPGSAPTPSTTVLQSNCLDVYWAQRGSCDYRITFHPISTGRKTAQLVVEENGETATATLAGEGMFGCRPYLVACNYADFYEGTYIVTTDESALAGDHKGHWVTTVQVDLANRKATCSGTQNDWEEEWNDGKLTRRSTAVGSINGPGLFAIEFRRDRQRGGYEYLLSFACPSPTIITSDVDHLSGNSATGRIPSEAAVWSRGGLAADPQPAGSLGSSGLSGTQKDRRADDGSGSGLTGTTTMTWSFTRWQ